MDRRRFRKLVFDVHQWLGLNLCILLAVIFATGTLLMFSAELNFAHKPKLWIKPVAEDAPRASAGQIYDSVLSKREDGRIDIIATAPRPWFGRAVYTSFGTAFVHPTTAEVVAFGGGNPIRKLIRQTHDSLLVPVSYANVFVNFLSFVVLALVTTGLITYRRFWKGFFRGPRKSSDSRGRKGALHRLTAVWIAPFLIASALASSVFFANAIGWKSIVPEPTIERSELGRLPEGFDGDDLDGLISICTDAVPTFRDHAVYMPRGTNGAVRVVGTDTAIGGMFAGATCVLDPHKSTLTGFVRTSDGNAMAWLKTLAVNVHYGTWAGWWSIGLWVVGGVGSVYLALTGAQVYASRIAREGTGGGTISTVVRGLGVFKWAYLALALGMCAVVVYRLIS